MGTKINYDSDLYAAFKKLRLIKSTASLNTVTTLWRGEIIMCEFSNITNEIVSVTASQLFEPEDFINLENLIIDFFSNPS